ncbi:MAG: hypothetical protein KGJ02_02135 [Verrucomicrobiota bacterium]|nr:hypothetical protein [Verrucomicrobiota bacterium]
MEKVEEKVTELAKSFCTWTSFCIQEANGNKSADKLTHLFRLFNHGFLPSWEKESHLSKKVTQCIRLLPNWKAPEPVSEALSPLCLKQRLSELREVKEVLCDYFFTSVKPLADYLLILKMRKEPIPTIPTNNVLPT